MTNPFHLPGLTLPKIPLAMLHACLFSRISMGWVPSEACYERKKNTGQHLPLLTNTSPSMVIDFEEVTPSRNIKLHRFVHLNLQNVAVLVNLETKETWVKHLLDTF